MFLSAVFQHNASSLFQDFLFKQAHPNLSHGDKFGQQFNWAGRVVILFIFISCQKNGNIFVLCVSVFNLQDNTVVSSERHQMKNSDIIG